MALSYSSASFCLSVLREKLWKSFLSFFNSAFEKSHDLIQCTTLVVQEYLIQHRFLYQT